MARTSEEPFFGTNDPLTMKKWATSSLMRTLEETKVSGQIGGDSAIIMDRTDLQTGGDEVTYDIIWNASAPGVYGNTKLEGKEEDRTIYSASLRLDHSRHAIRLGDKISAQRNPRHMRNNGRRIMTDWGSNVILEPSLFNHLCSYTPANTDTASNTPNQRGHNTILAATSSRTIRSGAAATDEALAGDSTKKFNLTMIDYAIERANSTAGNSSRMTKPSTGKYVCYVHWSQLTDLYADDRWEAIHIAAIQGANKNESLFRDVQGLYRDVLIIPSNFVTPGVHSTSGASVANVRRAVFCGAGAASICFGQGYAGGAWDWVEEKKDYQNEANLACGLIWGCKADYFNSVEYAKILLPSYAAPHFSS